MKTTIVIEIDVFREPWNPYANPGEKEKWTARDADGGEIERGVSVQDAVQKLLMKLAGRYAVE